MVAWVEHNRVRILSGAFEGFTGTIEGAENDMSDNCRTLEIFGAVTAVVQRSDELIVDDCGPNSQVLDSSDTRTGLQP